jgi:hypothetical protein
MRIFSKPRPAATADSAGPAPVLALLDVLAGRAGESLRQLDAAGWGAFVSEASRHGVAALAYIALARRDGVPHEVVRTLEGHYLRNRLRNLRLYARLGALLERFSDEAIGVVVLKGAYLAQTVYLDPALRAMSDADVLVRQRDLQRAQHLLLAMGWQQGAPLATGNHQLPTFELEGTQVDVHWNIEDDAAPFEIDVEGLWERAAPARVGLASVLALSPEDLLLHLCLHSGYGHGWKQFDGGLRQLADIAAAIHHHGAMIDWQTVCARAQSWRAERCVWLCLVTARDLLQAPVPQGMLDRLAQPQLRWAIVARELTLGCHYAELARRLPLLARLWVTKQWRHLSRYARWRSYLLPERASLTHVYPRLEARSLLMLLAHWRDLAGDVVRVTFDAGGRALMSRERERRALTAWLER